MKRLVYTSFAAVLALGGCETYVQHRAALVPHAIPVQTNGQPLDNLAAVQLSGTSIADVTAPTAGTNPADGIAVAEHQMRGALALAPSDNFHFSVFHERALAENAHKISDTIPPLDDRSAAGYGFSLEYSVPTSVPGFRVAVTTELTVWNVPYVQYTTATSTGATVMDKGYDDVSTAALGLTPSYRSGHFVGFGGITVRNHPSLLEKTESIGWYESPNVQNGPPNITLAAGGAFIQDNLQFALSIVQTVTQEPVQYGPSIGLSVSLGFGKRAPKPPPVPAVYYVPAPAGPPGAAPPTPAMPPPQLPPQQPAPPPPATESI